MLHQPKNQICNIALTLQTAMQYMYCTDQLINTCNTKLHWTIDQYMYCMDQAIHACNAKLVWPMWFNTGLTKLFTINGYVYQNVWPSTSRRPVPGPSTPACVWVAHCLSPEGSWSCSSAGGVSAGVPLGRTGEACQVLGRHPGYTHSPEIKLNTDCVNCRFWIFKISNGHQ